MPEGPTITAPGGSTFEGSPLCAPSATCAVSCSVPVEQVDTVWRDITGAATLCSGPLYCFTRRALADSLDEEWAPTAPVQRALRDRLLDTPGRAAPVMSSASAVSHVARRAHAHVRAAVEAVDAVALSTDGPRNVTRAMEALDVWACGHLAAGAVGGCVWESVLVGCCPSLKRKQR